MNNTDIYFAPLQGYTDAVYRRAHASIFGGVSCYYSPFARVEHGEVRRKELRDIQPSANNGLKLRPQLLANEPEKARLILDQFVELGYRDADVNLGCPFPVLAKRHNGSGMLPYPAEVEQLLCALIESYPNVSFSVKLRLGWESAEECLALLPLFNALPLDHITLHPRLGKQQYKGDVDLDAFERFYVQCQRPLVYNGDLLSMASVDNIVARFPKLKGVMLGRGLLANPALALEWQQKQPLAESDKLARIKKLHDAVYADYEQHLQGDERLLLGKMQTFWEYLLPEGDRKAKKIIKKTSKLTNYAAAVRTLLG